MRPYLVIALFAVAAFAAACGGGGQGSSSALPTVAGPGSTPLRYTNAKLSLKIPAQQSASSSRRPAYVSPNTKSVQITVQPVPAPSASPSSIPSQTFAVTTPTPCTQNADGSKTCTFDVQAPFGQDRFVINTYSVANPSPSDTPLATFETGTIDVTPGSTAPPINFTLTGVVATVDLTMQSPDPSVTPSTEFWPAGTPTTRILGITPRDSSGAAILTDTFVSPVKVTLNTTGAGVSLSLASSQCSPASSLSGTTATITCAKDLGAVKYAYDGTIAYNSADNVIDHITFSAQPNRTVQSATFALLGAVISQPFPMSTTFPYQMFFSTAGNGTFNYIAAQTTGTILGTLDPSNPSAAPNVGLSYYASGITTSSFGDIWLADHESNSGNTTDTALQCYTSITASPQPVSLPNSISPFAVGTDSNGNVWYFGQDQSQYLNWAGYIIPGSNCAYSFPSAPPVQIGSQTDYPQAVAAAPNIGGNPGVYLQSQSNGNIYYVNTGTSSAVTTPVAAPGSYYGQGLASDGAGNTYAALLAFGAPASIIGELTPGGTLNTATLENGANPLGISVFPSAGTASRLALADGTSSIDLVDPSSAFGATNLQIVPVSYYELYSTFFDKNGDAWIAGENSSGVPELTHVVRTSSWTILNSSLSVPTNGGIANIEIIETGDSGPFTISNISNPSIAATAAPWPGVHHVIPLQINSGGGSTLTFTVTDAHRRSQTKTYQLSYYVSGARRHISVRIPSRRAASVPRG